MATLLSRALLASLAGGLMLAASVNAAPITAEFSGTVTHYSLTPNGTPITERIGALIYGYVVYNVANAEISRVEPAINGGGYDGVFDLPPTGVPIDRRESGLQG